MGQYYKVVNFDKKEFLGPRDRGNTKLMEFAFWKNEMTLAMMNLMVGRWKGDRVYVVGDYMCDNNMNYIYFDIARNLINELGIRGTEQSIYDYIKENFRNISAETDHSDLGYRYIYNHSDKCYIDIENCPVERSKRKENRKIAPLPLLLAMGNGLGGGDYFGKNNHLVGKWYDSVRSIEITKERLPELVYEEFIPDFTENDLWDVD